MSIGKDRLAHLHEDVERLRRQTEWERTQCRGHQTGVTFSRYDRVLDNAEKVLIDHADEIIAGNQTTQYPEVVLCAMDILGYDTDEWGWAPHAERAERMGW